MKSYKNKLKRFLASIGADKDKNRDKLNILNYQLTEILSENKYFDHEKISLKITKGFTSTSLVEGIKIIETLNITNNILGMFVNLELHKEKHLN